MTFTIEIKCDNAAFESVPAVEISRILRKVLSHLDVTEMHYLNGTRLLDVNGNNVGKITVDYDD